jgi:hypothetical protein
VAADARDEAVPPEPFVYAPLNTCKPLAQDIWIVDGPVVAMAALGLRMPFPTRMTVVRLADGGLWCHSPIAPDAALFEAIDALGPVRHLVSPNLLHYAHVAAWKRRYPQAMAWASPGVRRRAASQRIEVHFDADLDDAPPPDWAGCIEQMRFRGSRAMQEFVFLHRASGTLILTDLIENFELARLRGPMRWLARLGGVLDPDGKAPWDLRLTYLGGKRQARACLARMLAWQPQRVVFAHGRWFPDHAMTELRRAFRWLD